MERRKKASFKKESTATILLSISEKIATIRDKGSLIEVIKETIKPYFGFDQIFVSVTTANNTHKVIMSSINEGSAHSNAYQYIHDTFLPNYPVYTQTIESVEPVIFTIQEIIENKLQSEEAIRYHLDGNTKYNMGISMQYAGETIGAIFLSYKEVLFDRNNLSLFKNIANQLAVAVANILANEEILEREREKTVLLSLNEAAASIRDKNELWQFMIDSVQPLTGFKISVSTIYSKDYSQYCYYLFSGELLTTTEKNVEERLRPYWGIYLPIQNTSDEWVCQQGDICALSIEQKEIVAKNNSEAIGILKALSIDYNVYIKLKANGRVFGVQHFHFTDRRLVDKKKIVFLKSVTDLIASSLANILANEEILEREREKTKLLEITKLIAQIKGTEDLLRLIVKNIQPIFNFHDCGLFVLSPDGNTHTDLAAVMPDVSPSEWNEMIALVSQQIPQKDSPVEWMIDAITAADTPVLFDFEELVEKFPTYPQLDSTGVLEMGYRDCLGFNLISRGKIIGMFCINALQKDFFKPAVFPIFQSVSESISIAVANIIANEEILEREREKTILLSISEAVATIRDKKELLKFVFEKVKPLFGFHDAGFFVFNHDKQFIDDWTVAMPETSPSTANYKIAANSTSSFLFHESALEPFYRQLKKIKTPAIANYNEELFAQDPDYPQWDAIKESGYKESIGTLLRAGDGDLGILFFNSLTENHFSEADFSLFQGIADQLAGAVANILASEDIKNKANEIDTLNKQLQAQNEYLIQEVTEDYNFEEMIGQNKQFQEACNSIGLVAKTDSTVLILGETGTGKELVARAIHNISSRKNKPLIKINCAALPANLIESELFGHERGAFTGAIERRIGKFELANGSTLFLDEVGELPLELQTKLLRALQEKEIERLGSNKTIQTDVRIIAATNRDLMKEVKDGKFRQDLYYRLHIFPLTLPPLRERKEDLPLLASHFIKRYSKKIGKNIQGLSHKAIEDMMSYTWPGNIRELEHIIERSIILSKTKLIQDLNLPLASKSRITASPNEFVIKTWEEQERDYILEVLKVTKGNMAGKGGAAELLQLPPTTLQSKMKRLGIKRGHYVEEK